MVTLYQQAGKILIAFSLPCLFFLPLVSQAQDHIVLGQTDGEPNVPVTGTSPGQSDFWTVQVGSYKHLTSAKKDLGQIPNLNCRIEKIGSWYTVRCGLVSTKIQAQELRIRLQEAGHLNTVIRNCRNVPDRMTPSSSKHPGVSIREPGAPRSEKDGRTVRQAVLLARKGQTDRAISLLKPIVKRRPGDQKLLGDYIVILGWAGKDEEALAFAHGIDLEKAPSYVINSLAKSARNLDRFDRSLELYGLSIKRQPGTLDSQIGLALTLSDAGRFDEALKFLDTRLKKQPRNSDLLIAKAYAYESKGDRLQALWIYEEILRSNPGRKDARRLRILAISSLGAPGLALSLADKHPDLLNDGDLRRIQGDWAAAKVKWGELPAASEAERFLETDEALKILQDNAEKFSRQAGEKTKSSEVLRTRFDRIIALRDRVRMEDVTAEYESLISEGVSPPSYVLSAVGDAYLYLEQPEKALEIYNQALRMTPESYDIQHSLFWANLELGAYDSALEMIDKLAAGEPRWRINRVEGETPVYRRNDSKLMAESSAALVRALMDNLDPAQQRFEELLNAAPFNHDLRQRLGYVYLWRGWPRRALNEFDLILQADPVFLDARVGKAYTLMDLREYRKAEKSILELFEEYPEHKRVRKLKRDWDVHQKRILTTKAGYGSDSATDQNTDSFRIDTTLYSSPTDYNFRMFLRSFYEKATIDEVTGNEKIAYQREGAGVQYEGPGVAGQLELSQNKRSSDDIDFAGRVDWEPNDSQTAGVSFDTFSPDTPFRARLNDIRAWSGSLALAYRANESSDARLDLQRMEFSDDNVRLSGLFTAKRRLYSGPYFKLPISFELYGSRNTETNTPYFNPEKDLSGALTLDFRWLLWRHYTRSFAHNLAFTGGRYWQKGFDTENVGSIRYEHDWNMSDTVALLYGVVWSRRAFDGDPENSTWTYLDLTWRF